MITQIHCHIQVVQNQYTSTVLKVGGGADYTATNSSTITLAENAVFW